MAIILIRKQEQLNKSKHEHILRIFANTYEHNPKTKREGEFE
jgi:hypothetical protein